MLLRVGLAVFAGLMTLTGLGFLLAAADSALLTTFPSWLAAAIVGGALVVVAAGFFLIAMRRPRRRHLAPEEVVLAAIGLAARSVRVSPEKAMVAALIAGVVSEWLGERGAGKHGKKK